MKCKKGIITGICLICILFTGKPGTAQATESVPEVHTEESYAVILEAENYVQVSLGKCYPGKSVTYDISNQETILDPPDGQKQFIVREKEASVLYYGKYRGREEYDNYQLISPVLDIEFFFNPFRIMELDVNQIEAEDYHITVDQEQEIEYFFTPLVFAGVLNEEEVAIESVEILFDEQCRPTEVTFNLQSDMLTKEQIAYLEEEVSQKFEYITEEAFDEKMAAVQEMLGEIIPEEEITIADYVTDLPNILRTEDEYFIQRLAHQGEELSYWAGWDKKAIFAYLEAVDTKLNVFGENGYEARNVTKEEYLQELENIYKSAHQIGSDVYTYMFKESEMEPKKKALLVLRQMGGYIDENGMLQLGMGDRFAPEMTPHSEFLEDYAECVQEAYKKIGNRYKQLDNKMIHQFRMYIDKHNVEYIRKYYKGPTDYERLKAYAKNFGIKLYYGEPSRHHNKIQKKTRFKSQRYDKILTPNRLSEFIIDVETGDFVTEWDVLGKEKNKAVESEAENYAEIGKKAEQKIVDTESFNYAPADHVEAHNCLDVLPASPSANEKKYLENQLKCFMKEIWESPKVRSYKEKYKSPKDYLK